MEPASILPGRILDSRQIIAICLWDWIVHPWRIPVIEAYLIRRENPCCGPFLLSFWFWRCLEVCPRGRTARAGVITQAEGWDFSW
jgi:hypothetical protein